VRRVLQVGIPGRCVQGVVRAAMRGCRSVAREVGRRVREGNTPLTNQKQFAYIRHAEVGRYSQRCGKKHGFSQKHEVFA
jgi:hypothetical protein